MYPTDQSISSYGSNPSTPINSPPPLTTQPQNNASTLHGAGTSGTATWQQLTPVINNSANNGLNNLQNSTYPSELVHRALHMVCKKGYFYFTFQFVCNAFV